MPYFPPSSSGTPATTVTSEIADSVTAAVGTSTNYAREDHTHGTPSMAMTNQTVAKDVTVPDAHSVEIIDYYEIASGNFLELAATCIVEIDI